MDNRRCKWITGIGSAGKNNHCNKIATYRNRFGWDYYYCDDHAHYIETMEGGRYKGSNEPISRFRRFLERIRKAYQRTDTKEGGQ